MRLAHRVVLDAGILYTTQRARLHRYNPREEWYNKMCEFTCFFQRFPDRRVMGTTLADFQRSAGILLNISESHLSV